MNKSGFFYASMIEENFLGAETAGINVASVPCYPLLVFLSADWRTKKASRFYQG